MYYVKESRIDTEESKRKYVMFQLSKSSVSLGRRTNVKYFHNGDNNYNDGTAEDPTEKAPDKNWSQEGFSEDMKSKIGHIGCKAFQAKKTTFAKFRKKVSIGHLLKCTLILCDREIDIKQLERRAKIGLKASGLS